MKTLPINSNLFFFYSLFQESRRLVSNQQSLLKFVYLSVLSIIIFQSLNYFSPNEYLTAGNNCFTFAIILFVCKGNLWNKESENSVMRKFPNRRKCIKFIISHKTNIKILGGLALLEALCFRALGVVGYGTNCSMLYIYCSLGVNYCISNYFDDVFVLNIRSLWALPLLALFDLLMGMVSGYRQLVVRVVYSCSWVVLVPFIMYAKKKLSKTNLDDQTILQMFFNTRLGMHSPK
jgi:hypothetical protein